MTSAAPGMAINGSESLGAHEVRKVIFASSLGTVFEWYDFYLYATLAPFFAGLFFPKTNATAALLGSFVGYAAGFLVRPFGALVFGRIGDLVGRKYTFLITIMVMGLSTALVGALPTFEKVGWLSPILLMVLRLSQGLALGGEYGGAATYVAEHAPDSKRGLHTSWIQTTATLGFFISLLVIYACRANMDAKAFTTFGWRIPFLVSLLLLAISVYIRLKLNESPVFLRMKSEGKGSRQPIRDSFANWPNAKIVLLALFGAAAGQGVVWYTGQFYALFFLTTTLKLDWRTSYGIVAWALALGTGLFILFGWLSDKIGRKKIMMVGCLLGAVTYFPLFKAMTSAANPALERFAASTHITVTASGCNVHLFPTPATVYSPCDKATDFLAKRSLSFERIEGVPGTAPITNINGVVITGVDEAKVVATLKALKPDLFVDDGPALAKPDPAKMAIPKANPADVNKGLLILLVLIQVVFVTMVYGPIAAFLVELFPARIRYTSMSLPYHIGNGWFGGMLPLTAAALVVANGNIYAGLWYPVVVAALSFLIGTLFIRETRDHRISTL
ncbi:MAG TPA: MFS transporter [Polyangia bacterium]|nr:MFS transporter [Polyangia bacterium]